MIEPLEPKQLAGNEYIPDREVGVHYQIHRGIGIHQKLHNDRHKPFRVAGFVGDPPAMAFSAVMPLPEGMPEVAAGRETSVNAAQSLKANPRWNLPWVSRFPATRCNSKRRNLQYWWLQVERHRPVWRTRQRLGLQWRRLRAGRAVPMPGTGQRFGIRQRPSWAERCSLTLHTDRKPALMKARRAMEVAVAAEKPALLPQSLKAESSIDSVLGRSISSNAVHDEANPCAQLLRLDRSHAQRLRWRQ